ncbi:right-handed parallel beta-helix repeat-containing protein [Puniceicoccus vermicola]|uniref:Right-handed parallel beta-helix repeat-containing protein n=1 Tax=Puniceicoccus vermicola TaxID=388746 RepID=A0A7X1B111_9BACT|nr:right-handed parallel beta-helix repeat-containing protein [Puniceicoccus vermicola]MBC2602563.1 right-handed parallel beta-helix repeat-containing protein [Puniceicoccus vermicola]
MKLSMSGWKSFFFACIFMGTLVQMVSAGSLETERQAGVELQKRIREALQQGEKKIVIPKGTYRVSSGESRAAFALTGVEDVVIEGHDATVIVEDLFGAFQFSNCRGVILRGITLDMDPLPYVQGTIVQVDDESGRVLLEMDEGYESREVLDAYFSLKLAVLFDSDEGRLVPGYADCSVKSLELADERRLWVKLNPYDNGMSLTQCGYKSGLRLTLSGKGQPIISQNDCESMVFEDVSVFASAGLAVYERASKNQTVYRGCSIIRKPGSQRLLAGNADGFHSSMAKVGPHYESCRVEALCDDGFAVHGFFSLLLAQPSEDTVIIAPLLRRDFDVGDELVFYQIRSMDSEGSAKVVAVEKVEDLALIEEAKALPSRLTRQGQRIIRMATQEILSVRLNRNLDLSENALVESNGWSGSGSEIRNCSIDNLRGRAILIQSTDVRIVGNRASWISGPAMELSGEVPWMQGPFSERIVVKDNVLEDVGLSVSAKASYKTALGAISLHAYYGGNLKEGFFPIRDIEISGNTINRSYLPAVSILNASDVEVRGNVFSDSNLSPVERAGEDLGISPSEAIVIAGSEKVILSGNQFEQTDPQASVGILINP